MNGNLVTTSERVFSELCARLGYQANKVPMNPPKKTPDFKVASGENIIFAEVKQFDVNKIHKDIQSSLNNGGPHVDSLDFLHDGGLQRKAGQAAEQLKSKSREGYPTILVIYSERFLGPTDYQVNRALERGEVCMPPEISAIMVIKNEHIHPSNPSCRFFENPDAAVKLPVGWFLESR